MQIEQIQHLEVLELGPAINDYVHFFFYISDLRMANKLIIDCPKIIFYDCNNFLIPTDTEEIPLVVTLPTYSYTEIVFGKKFSGYITCIIPPSVTKCTLHRGCKGNIPETVKEIIYTD